MMLMAGSSVPATQVEFTFAPATSREVPIAAAPVAATEPNIGTLGGQRLALAAAPSVLPARGSRSSTLYRARDVVDIAAWPARAVAKLYRLDAGGKRTATACTAQFVGPRHLVTAGHCVVDRSNGTPHAGFELAVGHDRGTAASVHRVSRAWIARADTRIADPAAEIVTPDRCHDLAVLEIAQPVGASVGWFGMRAEVSDQPLHRFSYPHQSAAITLVARAADPSLPDVVRKALIAAAEKAKQSEPDFSPDNLYYEHGRPDEVQTRYIADRNGYTMPGRSGSASFDGSGAIVALLSRSYGGATYSCRLGADDIGTVAAIIRRG